MPGILNINTGSIMKLNGFMYMFDNCEDQMTHSTISACLLKKLLNRFDQKKKVGCGNKLLKSQIHQS